MSKKYLNEQLDINVYNGPDNASSFCKINAARRPLNVFNWRPLIVR